MDHWKCTVTKTPIITAIPFLLEHYRLFPNLYIDEHTGLTTIKNQIRKKKINFHKILMLIFVFRNLAYVYQWYCFTLPLTKFIDILALVCILPYQISIKNLTLHFFKICHQFSFMIIILAKCIKIQIWNKTKLPPFHFLNR